MRYTYQLEKKVARQAEEIRGLCSQANVAQSRFDTAQEELVGKLRTVWNKKRLGEQRCHRALEERLQAYATHLEEEKVTLERRVEHLTHLTHHCQYLQQQLPPLLDTQRVWSLRTVRMVVKAMHAGHLSLSSTERVYSIFAELFLGQVDVEAPDRRTIADWSAEIYNIQ